MSDHSLSAQPPQNPHPSNHLKPKCLPWLTRLWRTQLPTTSPTHSQLLFSFHCNQTGLRLLLTPTSMLPHVPARLHRALCLQRFTWLTPLSPPQGLLNCHLRASPVTSLFIFSHSAYDSLAYYIFYLFFIGCLPH